jgi:hypothetical protein
LVFINHVFENLTLCITDGHYQKNIYNIVNVQFFFDIDNLISAPIVLYNKMTYLVIMKKNPKNSPKCVFICFVIKIFWGLNDTNVI